jgi:acyl-homoserine lactone acylase PvdQ
VAAARAQQAQHHVALRRPQGRTIAVAIRGRHPVRHPDQDSRFPTPGTGEREWTGFLAPEDVPHAANPARGFLDNWNNHPAAGWGKAGGSLRARRSAPS